MNLFIVNKESYLFYLRQRVRVERVEDLAIPSPMALAPLSPIWLDLFSNDKVMNEF